MAQQASQVPRADKYLSDSSTLKASANFCKGDQEGLQELFQMIADCTLPSSPLYDIE